MLQLCVLGESTFVHVVFCVIIASCLCVGHRPLNHCTLCLYIQRVSGAEHVAQYWYDYGVFCLLIGRLDKAEQCLKEAVALDQKMMPA